MITIHLHTPGSPSSVEYAVAALSDAEALNLPTTFLEPGLTTTLHLVNELAYDAFRLAVVQGHIAPESIRVRIHTKDTVLRGRINRFGVFVDKHDSQADTRFHSAANHVIEEILMAASRRIRKERQENILASVLKIDYKEL